MATFHWTNNDAGYEKWLSEHPDGFMANLNHEPHRRYFKIHRATHNLPDRSTPDSVNPRTGNDYSKVTANELSELIAWAKEHIPSLVLGEGNYCKTCDPTESTSASSAPTADPKEYHDRADKILARGPVPRPKGIANPVAESASTKQFYRDPKVRAWVLQRAEHRCELCDAPAPFLTDNEEPFLESHHLVLLADGGPDTPENTSALCPNCHRKLHYGKERGDLSAILKQKIMEKEGG